MLFPLNVLIYAHSVPEGNVIFIKQKSDNEGKATAAR